MGPSSPYFKLIYLVGMNYEVWIDSKFTFVHKGVMVIMQGCIWVPTVPTLSHWVKDFGFTRLLRFRFSSCGFDLETSEYEVWFSLALSESF